MNWIMLNPSTADEEHDDPTIRRCIGFSKIWGFSSLIVTNLFSYRSTDPRLLEVLAAMDPNGAIGIDNDGFLKAAAMSADAVVCAWGDRGGLLRRDKDLRAYLALQGIEAYCIRQTKRGNPAHPVREPYTDRMVVYG